MIGPNCDEEYIITINGEKYQIFLRLRMVHNTSNSTLYVAIVICVEFNMRRSVTREKRLCGVIASCFRLEHFDCFFTRQ